MGGDMRTCGECVVCCVYQRIDDPELKKDAMVHCKHLDVVVPEDDRIKEYSGKSCNNCKIYDHQPKMCGEYRCAWLAGFGDEGDRPDKSLMLFDCSHGILNSVEAKPLKHKHQETQEAQEVIDRFSKSMDRPVIVLDFYERRIQRIAGSSV
jgi:hypothetical protein